MVCLRKNIVRYNFFTQTNIRTYLLCVYPYATTLNCQINIPFQIGATILYMYIHNLYKFVYSKSIKMGNGNFRFKQPHLPHLTDATLNSIPTIDKRRYVLINNANYPYVMIIVASICII